MCLTRGTLLSCASRPLILWGDALSLGSQSSWGVPGPSSVVEAPFEKSSSDLFVWFG